MFRREICASGLYPQPSYVRLTIGQSLSGGFNKRAAVTVW